MKKNILQSKMCISILIVLYVLSAMISIYKNVMFDFLSQPFNFMFLIFISLYGVLYNYYDEVTTGNKLIVTSIYNGLLLCAVILSIRSYNITIILSIAMLVLSTLATLLIGIFKLRKRNYR